MTKVLQFVVASYVFSLCAFGTDVQWPLFDTPSGNGTQTIHPYRVLGSYFVAEINLQSTALASGGFEISEGGGAYAMEFIGNWSAASAGDIVSESTTRHKDSYFYHSTLDDSPPDSCYGTDYTPYSIFVEPDSSFYLMFAHESPASAFGLGPSEYVYGWIEVGVDSAGNLTLLDSAADLDGGPMIVGGGAYTGATPEPTAGVLLLLGAAALGLRRRSPRNHGGDTPN